VADDLILKYFQGDLTEAEEQALSERLLSSTEDALRFGQMAEKNYYIYGLPQPHWHGGGPSSGTGHSSSGSTHSPPGPLASSPGTGAAHGPWHFLLQGAAHLGLKPILLVSGLAAVGLTSAVVWHQTIKTQPTLPPVIQSVATPVSNPALPAASKVVHRSSVSKVKKRSVLIPALSSSMSPVLTPVNMTKQPHSTYSNLAVVIHQSASGPVTVKVLNLEDSPIVLLYQGALSPGSWVFDWNGKLPNGQAAPSGYYQIQVQAGSRCQKKVIQIH
jgi:hypothetical protein